MLKQQGREWVKYSRTGVSQCPLHMMQKFRCMAQFIYCKNYDEIKVIFLKKARCTSMSR